MHKASFPLLVALSVVGSGCAGGAPAPAAPGGCEIAPVGPLIGYTYQPSAAPPPQGGPIVDGVYDLVEAVVYGKASGPWSSDQAPAVRLAMKLTTEDRAAGPQGRVVMSMNLPPALECQTGRFAAIGAEIRTQTTGSHSKLESNAYTTGPDTLTVFQRANHTYVFRRRP